MYNGDGKHVAEVRGQLLKSDYTFFQADGKTEMGKVSKKWAGALKDSSLIARRYFESSSHLWASPKYLQRLGKPVKARHVAEVLAGIDAPAIGER